MHTIYISKIYTQSYCDSYSQTVIDIMIFSLLHDVSMNGQTGTTIIREWWMELSACWIWMTHLQEQLGRMIHFTIIVWSLKASISRWVASACWLWRSDQRSILLWDLSARADGTLGLRYTKSCAESYTDHGLFLSSLQHSWFNSDLIRFNEQIWIHTILGM